MTKRKTQKYIYTKKDYKSGDGMLTAVWGSTGMAFYSYNIF